MNHSTLFQSIQVGALSLPNRIVLAPMTRSRAEARHVPGALMAEYYAQRASGGLLITEATMAIKGNSAFIAEPGIYSDEQIAGWRLVTDAVHAADGRIVLQLWHGGRACHPALNDGAIPVAPSAIPITGDEIYTPDGKKPYVTPRALQIDEIADVIIGFRKAAENAKAAGFDGVELHAANGYLIDQFLRDGSNHRTDAYGGSLENRARLLWEIIEAVTPIWGADRIGVRLSPLNPYNSMSDSDPVRLVSHLAAGLDERKIAYLHIMRGPAEKPDLLQPIRENFHGVVIANKKYTPAEAESQILAGTIDAVAFGVPYLANPDYPERIAAGAALNEPDYGTFYSTGPKGYTDYPCMDQVSC